MKHKRFALVSLLPLLFSCARMGIDDPQYVQELSAKGDGADFVVLQLTDIHWNYSTNIEEASAYLNNTIRVAKEEKGHIDLIEVTGDSLLVANKKIATTLYDLIDSWGIKWAFTFGNHDYEGEWSEAWMNELVSSSHYKNAVLPEEVNKLDDVDGYSNYVINVKWGNDVNWQIYNIDTHNLVQQSGSYDYDYVHPNQVSWYKSQTELAKKADNTYTPSIAFFHIPTSEINDMKEEEKIGGIKDEKYCPGKTFSEFYGVAKERNCRGMFFGHDHSNDIVWKHEGVVYGYGVKANIELYSTEKDDVSITGCALYSLHKNGTFDLEHLIIDYDNMEQGKSSLSWEVKDL